LSSTNQSFIIAENIRRMFYRWLSAARSARHRRMTLQRKEDKMKAACVAITWDRWRERFVEEKLRLIVNLPFLIFAVIAYDLFQEYDVIIQSQRNVLFHAFGFWQSKTKVSSLCGRSGISTLISYLLEVFARPQVSRFSLKDQVLAHLAHCDA
jgi:hypothetical protein